MSRIDPRDCQYGEADTYQFEKDVAAAIKGSMEIGEKYCPLSSANMREALEQSSGTETKLGWADGIALAAIAIAQGRDSSLVSEGAVLNCMQISTKYWKAKATVNVGRELGKFRSIE